MSPRLKNTISALLLTTMALFLTPAPTSATGPRASLDTRSLAAALAADGHGFDTNPHDFDIFEKFMRKVRAARPHSDVAMLWRGRQHVTAFLPTDGAWRRAARKITGHRFDSERRVFRTFRSLGGVRIQEEFVLFHVVPGTTLTRRELRAAAPTRLRTAQGGFLRIRARDRDLLVVDRLEISPNARMIPALRNFNKGNRQIAQPIDWLQHPPG